MVKITNFGSYRQYILESEELRVSVMELGATVTAIDYRGRRVGLGYERAENYLTHGAYLGAIVGRFANRIGGGVFPLGGERVQLALNENGNTLHGGPGGFAKLPWDVVETTENKVVLSIVSEDGDQGFPVGISWLSDSVI